MSRSEETDYEPDKVVVRDKRRLDPTTGALREEAAAPEAAPAPEAPDALTDQAAPDQAAPDQADGPVMDERVVELTESLMRLQAEYANYRKRVERDRGVDAARATAVVLSGLLPMLDDIDRARQHGDLVGAFKGVGEGLEAVAAKLGLERFGDAGEPFDPTVHEAVMQAEPDDTTAVSVCAQVFQPGFRVGPLVLRPARVSVAEGTGTDDAQAEEVVETPSEPTPVPQEGE